MIKLCNSYHRFFCVCASWNLGVLWKIFFSEFSERSVQLYQSISLMKQLYTAFKNFFLREFKNNLGVLPTNFHCHEHLRYSPSCVVPLPHLLESVKLPQVGLHHPAPSLGSLDSFECSICQFLWYKCSYHS